MLGQISVRSTWARAILGIGLGATGAGCDAAPTIAPTPEGSRAARGVDLACSDVPVSLSLHQVWSYPETPYAIAVARMADTNGDGAVDLADNSMMALDALPESWLLDPVQRRRAMYAEGAWSSAAVFADADGLPGAELVVGWFEVRPGVGQWASVLGQHVRLQHPVSYEDAPIPVVADVDLDGDSDLVISGEAVDAATGQVVQSWAFPESVSPNNVAIDLDLDGAVEILTATPWTAEIAVVGVLGPNGQVDTPCMSTKAWSHVVFAVGNLDDDPEGEFVAASKNRVAVCDSDGSMLYLRSIELEEPFMAALADLDGDGRVEVVLSGEAGGSPSKHHLMALDRQLYPKWTRASVSSEMMPFSVADLDANGDHELVVGGVGILDGDDTLLEPFPEAVMGWRASPIVVDVDGDGLAEIVVAGSDLTVYENAEGGFPAPGAAEGWSGFDHYPGRLALSGVDPATRHHWLEPGNNAWQGHGVCPP